MSLGAPDQNVSNSYCLVSSSSTSVSGSGNLLTVILGVAFLPGGFESGLRIEALAVGGVGPSVITPLGIWTKPNLPAVTPPPAILDGGVVPVYSTVPTIQPGEWVSIFGTSLASLAVTWAGNFPPSLGGTSVTIDGNAAYLWSVSPTQINLQVPHVNSTGTVPVVVTTTSGAFKSTVTLARFAPSFSLLDNTHVSGLF